MRNKAHPEGSIAEGYLAEECMTFCSRYLDSVETIFNRPARNIDGSIGAISHIHLDQKTWMQAHRYVLFNSNEVNPFRRLVSIFQKSCILFYLGCLTNNTNLFCLSIHKDIIKRQKRGTRPSEAVIHKIHMENFVDWFQSYVSINLFTRFLVLFN